MTSIDFYKPRDSSQLFKLFSEWDKSLEFDHDIFIDSLEKLISDNSRILIAREDNKLAGYAQIRKCHDLGFESFYEVVQLLVSQDMRGIGIGKTIITKKELNNYYETSGS